MWSVLPAIAAAVVLVLWTRRRIGRVAALVLAGRGVAAIVEPLVTGRRRGRTLLAGAAVVLLAIGVVRIVRVNGNEYQPPKRDYRGLADAFRGSGLATLISQANPPCAGLQWYLGDAVRFEGPAALAGSLCAGSGPIAFAQIVTPITRAEQACLLARHATVEDFPGRSGAVLRLWIAQSPGVPRFTAGAIG